MTQVKYIQPAFPVVASDHVDGPHYAEHGMTLRDYFAAKALQGLISNQHTYVSNFDQLSEHTYRIADAMMEARNK